MNNQFELVNSLIEEALDLSPVQQEAFLVEQCGRDDALLARVRRLLALSGSLDSFLDSPAAPLSDVQPGDLLGGRFRIIEELGAGSAAAIFLAHDSQLGEVALKILHPEFRAGAQASGRLLAEIGAARAIRHPNVCPVYDLFLFEQENGVPLAAVTMKRLHGETLAARLARGPVPPAEAFEIATGIAAGLDALHAEGIVHRDLKPDNIMLSPKREGGVIPVIMDFGLASQTPAGAAPSGSGLGPGAISGSPDYMAPEQFRSAAVTPAADIYALGLILFEMIAGMRPFPAEELLPAVVRRITEDAPRLFSVAPKAPLAWGYAIARALSRDPLRRPASARAMLDEIARCLSVRESPTAGIVGLSCVHRPRKALSSRARRSRSASSMRPV